MQRPLLGNRPPSMSPKKERDALRNLVIFLGVLCASLFVIGVVLVIVFVSHENDRNQHFDYVVVGGGPAGCVVAERLSRDGKYTVLLLEAGPDVQDDPVLNIIGPNTGSIEDKYYGKYFWQHAQEYAEVIPARLSLQLTTGRLLGGGSKINGGQFVRGTKWMFDTWEEDTDDPIWSVSNVLDKYKELETFHGPSFDPSVRGGAGPLSVWEGMTTSPQTSPTTMAEKLTTAFEQFTGLQRLPDYNNLSSAAELGPFLRWQVTAYPNGTRSSADVSIMNPQVRARNNLRLSVGSTAVQVLFNNHKRARAVRYIHEGKEYVAHASKRIILSAGINTAEILEHSGIGDGAYLTELGIPVIYDNPNVGNNMINQQLVSAVFLKNGEDAPSENPADIYEGGAWLPDPNDEPTEDVSPRRIQIIGINAGPVMALVAINLQPIEAGYTHIRDKDPLRVTASSDRIFVSSNGVVDLITFVKAIQKYICALHDEFQGTGVGPAVDPSYSLIDPPLSICSNETLLSEWVVANAKPHTHHWTSACKMGKLEDGISVVNSKGSVWGVHGLTIADDSILPRNHDGNTVAPAYLVGKVIAEEVAAGRF
jgi:choline dehydrogenase